MNGNNICIKAVKNIQNNRDNNDQICAPGHKNGARTYEVQVVRQEDRTQANICAEHVNKVHEKSDAKLANCPHVFRELKFRIIQFNFNPKMTHQSELIVSK